MTSSLDVIDPYAACLKIADGFRIGNNRGARAVTGRGEGVRWARKAESQQGGVWTVEPRTA
jgi:hypothetical protein